jgi:hypothetical protein
MRKTARESLEGSLQKVKRNDSQAKGCEEVYCSNKTASRSDITSPADFKEW